MKPSLEDMLVFETVVTARSFTSAAQQLGKTKSAVSQAITRMETDLGVTLLNRSTRSLNLTEAGARLLSYCRDIKDSYSDALDDMATTASRADGTLTVTAPHVLCSTLVMKAVASIATDYPELKVRLIASDSTLDLIGDQVDIGVRVGAVAPFSARTAKLGTLDEGLYTSPGYLAKMRGMPKTTSDLQNWHHVGNDWQGTPITYDLLSGEKMRVHPHLRCTSLFDVLAAVKAGIGIAQLPGIIADSAVTNGQLVSLAPVKASPIHYLHHYDRHTPHKVQLFIEALKTAFKTDPSSASEE